MRNTRTLLSLRPAFVEPGLMLPANVLRYLARRNKKELRQFPRRAKRHEAIHEIR